jgi:hypothetical protein
MQLYMYQLHLINLLSNKLSLLGDDAFTIELNKRLNAHVNINSIKLTHVNSIKLINSA